MNRHELTRKQIEFLMDCHECEILNVQPEYNRSYPNDYTPLWKRGLVEPKKYIQGEKITLRFFITQQGKKVLASLI